jgi:hypothetical protein
MIHYEKLDVNARLAKKFLEKERVPEAGVKGTNRKHGDRTVQEYAEAMLRGEWELTHQGIAFNEKDEMVDGGHRLRAVILADQTKPGIKVPFMVASGLSASAMAAMDIGRRRVPSDFLRMAGEVNTPTLGGIIRLAYCYYNVEWVHTETWSRHRITPRMQEDFLDENPMLRDAVYETFALKRLFKSSALGAFWFIAKVERPDVDVDSFLEQLRTGELLTQGDPALKLRELMLNAKAAMRRFEASEELALLIKAFNRWIRGETVKQLSFRTDEAFPRIIKE